MTSAQVDQLTGRLQQLLEAAADDRTRQYWERYLKGAARFRGVPMAAIRTAVRTLWHTEQLSGWPTPQLVALAEHWFGQPLSEDKLAGTLLIAEHLAGRLTLEDGDVLARPLAEGKLADWSSCDWYATKALHAYLTANPEQLQARAELVAGWSTAANLWQRRAAVVAFVKLAPQSPPPFPGFVELLLAACANNLVSPDRFAHTGPGWLLRELSRSHPDQVARFVDAHPELSVEAARMATARLRPGPYRRR
jgi:3-methyladenine DNA glycosylase AlkD